jgi:hypothetical protein
MYKRILVKSLGGSSQKLLNKLKGRVLKIFFSPSNVLISFEKIISTLWKKKQRPLSGIHSGKRKKK